MTVLPSTDTTEQSPVHFPPQKTLKREENEVDAQLDFEEFVHYLQDYERDLKLVVTSVDKKNAGERPQPAFAFHLSACRSNLRLSFP